MHEAKTHLSRLVERAVAGEEIVIGKAGKPVARLIPYVEKREPRRLGLMRGQIWMAPDWDSDEVNEAIADLFEGKDNA